MLNPQAMLSGAPAQSQGTRRSRPARVVIAEDHPIMRDGLIDLLEQEPAFELAGCADSARQVESLVNGCVPDLLVLDLTLGSDDGVELAERLLRIHPGLAIVVLSIHDELMFADRLLALGVRAYLTKDRTRSEFMSAMRSALEGRTYLTTEQQSRRDCSPARSNTPTPERVLSARELAILRLLAAGKTSDDIAAELNMAPKTVYSHRRNIGYKLGITSGRDMIRYAVHWARGGA